MSIVEQIIIAMLTFITGGGLVTALNYAVNKGKTKAETRKLHAEIESLIDTRYERLILSLSKRIEELESENRQLLDELRAIRQSSERLEQKLTRISALIGGVMDETTRSQEPYQSILKELEDLREE